MNISSETKAVIKDLLFSMRMQADGVKEYDGCEIEAYCYNDFTRLMETGITLHQANGADGAIAHGISYGHDDAWILEKAEQEIIERQNETKTTN